MRETLSLLRLYHWSKSFWNGHYLFLIKAWGWRCIFSDTCDDFIPKIKEKSGARLAIHHKGEMPNKYLWSWEKMPKGYRWF